MENTQQTTNLAALFLEHAGGKTSERSLQSLTTRQALLERQGSILNFMSANKYSMSRETFDALTNELAAIGIELGKV